MLSNGLPPPENLLASISCCCLDRLVGSSCLLEVVGCGACISAVVDFGVDSGLDFEVDSEVDSDVGSGSPMPRPAEDFGASSEVVEGGASAVVVCGGFCDVVTDVDVYVGLVVTSVGATDLLGTSIALQTDSTSMFWNMRPRSVRLSTMIPGQTVLRVLEMLSRDVTHACEHAPPA